MKNKKIITSILTIIFMMAWFNSIGQAPGIEWQNTIGGSGIDIIHCLQQTSDGGYILGGISTSGISGDKNEAALPLEAYGTTGDYWVVKLSNTGSIQWQNTIGGGNSDWLYSIEQTIDGGYILGGFSFSGLSGDKTESGFGNGDFWVIKISNLGTIEWQNTLGGNLTDYLINIHQTIDGGYILGGLSNSDISGDKSEASLGSLDYWVVKLNNSGAVEWQNTIGGIDADHLCSIQQTIDGGFILGGYSTSGISGDKTEPLLGVVDYWIVKLNVSGEIEWQNTIGGDDEEFLYSMCQTNDGGYILGGYSLSGISGDKGEASLGGYDYWVVKLNNLGLIEWQNTIGGNASDYLTTIQQTNDNGFILGGYSTSGVSGDKAEPSLGIEDFWIVKLNNLGSIEWENTIGGSSSEILQFNTIYQTTDGGFILGGTSSSGISGDKTEPSMGSSDYWVIKLEASACIPETELCNSLDDNCNGLIDDDITETISITAGGPISFCQGGSVLLTATYSGASVQWKKNGTNIPGATSATFNVTTKGNYSCVTTSACGTAESTPIFVNVIKNPNASISAGGPTTFCAGGSVVLTEIAVAGCTYQWYKGASPIAGATALTYTATTSGNYKCRVTKAATGCYKNSNAIAVSVPCREGLSAGEAGEMLIDENACSIYPNPNNGTFTIEANVTTQDFASPESTIEIYNNLGQLIYSEQINSQDGIVNEIISIGSNVSGIYLLKIIQGDYIFQSKIVIE